MKQAICKVCNTVFTVRSDCYGIYCGKICRFKDHKNIVKKGWLNRENRTAWNKGLTKETDNRVTTYGHHIPHTEEGKKHLKENSGMRGKTGIKHPNYITDRTKLKKSNEERFSVAHSEWSKKVKSRDRWVCKISNQDCKGALEAHHILSWKDFPELRYELRNGISLCRFHHPRKRAKEIEMIPVFQKLLS